jgi:hypothetical protein
MIKLIARGGSGVHMVAALLDYCTEEGNLEGYPQFNAGKHLHSHGEIHKTRAPWFYEAPNLQYVVEKIDRQELDRKLARDFTQYQRIASCSEGDIIISPVANNNFGRLLIVTMAFGKSMNKQLPPMDNRLDYSKCASESDQIEHIAFILARLLKQEFDQFHGHHYPTYALDVMWFYDIDYKNISRVVESCNWHPKIEKVKEICHMIYNSNKIYYDSIRKCKSVYLDVVSKTARPCDLTIYETAMVHSLLIDYYDIESSEQVKLINQIPTSTQEFFDLYMS